jgi:predicted RNA binding protein YcfA (HicA-like mRNA interferase family)
MGLVETKRVQRLYEQVVSTRKNCSYDDLEALLLAVGFTVRKASGSHRIFKNGSLVITVPERKPVKEVYVEHALDLIERLRQAP